MCSRWVGMGAKTLHLVDLDDPSVIGRNAGERAVARLNPSRPKTAQLPVVYDPSVAGSLLGHLAGAINGATVARGTSFLKDRLGQRIFSAGVRISDDPHRVWANRIRAEAWSAQLSRPVAVYQHTGNIPRRLKFHPAGRYLLAVNGQGKIVWATPQAQKMLSENLPSSAGEEFILPEPTLEWLTQMQKGKAKAKAQTAALPENEQLQLQYMGKLGPNEFLLRLAKDSSADTPIEFSSELGLTTREGEVLSWLSKGKTNRDIAQILGLSPRTVDKHLEQIYAKLGVENRTAAAAIATSTNRRHS